MGAEDSRLRAAAHTRWVEADSHSRVVGVEAVAVEASGSQPVVATAVPAAECSLQAHRIAEGPSEFRRFRRTQPWADSTRHSVGIGHLSSQVTFKNCAKNLSANGRHTSTWRETCLTTRAMGDGERRSPILYPVLQPRGQKSWEFNDRKGQS